MTKFECSRRAGNLFVNYHWPFYNWLLMTNPVRQYLLLLVLLVIFAGTLGFAWTLSQRHVETPVARVARLVWHAVYPGTFRPLDLSHTALPVQPGDAMVQTLPDGSARYLYIFRLNTPATLPQASAELFEQFNRVRPQKDSAARMAGAPALDLSFISKDIFIVQRSVLIQGNLFAVTLVGNSDLSDDDAALFNQICDSVLVRRENTK